MTQPVEIDLSLGGNYTEGVQQATTATEGLEQAVSAVQAPARGLQRALDLATPTRAHLAAWGGFTAAAAYWQGQTSGIRATASAAGQSIRVLDGDVQRIARTFPIGTAGAVAMVQAVQGLGASEKRVGPLAVTMERISGATSTFGPQMATSFGQLNREMASLDPSRVQRFGDVLTTVSAKSGASAQGIVDFAQAIAPVAQQAGIGESAVLGISSAFVKLGDDGGAAATAVNKILGDLNRSVREGSNDMVAYAQVTGMTVEQFRKLYQANPSQALASVTTAIGRAGPQGQMMLESLGLEGTRTQRALLQLSQSGGLQQAVSQATGAYGNDSTAAAAKQAFGGLNDSLTELRSTVGQTADALGGPFLHVLTRITNIAKVGLAPVNAVLGSGPGQRTIQALGGLALTGMVARRVVRPLGGLALGYQAATSGPVRSLAGGYALSAAGGDPDAAMATRLGSFGRDPLIDSTYGVPYGRGGFMQGMNSAFLRAGQTLGAARASAFGAPTVGTGGPGFAGLVRGAGRAGVTASTAAYEVWARSFADPFRQASTPAGQRVSMLTPSPGGLLSQVNEVRQQAGLRVALGMLQKEGGTGAAALGRFSAATIAATKAVGTFTGGAIRAGATAGGGVLRGAASSAFGLLGGGLGVGLLAGGLAYTAYRSHQASQSAETERLQNLDVYGVLNNFRDAMGQAGQASVSMADVMKSAADNIRAAVTNFPAATSVTQADLLAAGNVTPASASKARDAAPVVYRGTNAQIQAQVLGMNIGGVHPQDVQAVKLEMLKQGMSPSRVQDVLSGLNTSGQTGRLTPQILSGLVGGAVGPRGQKFSSSITDELIEAVGQQKYLTQQKYGAKYANQLTARTVGQVNSLIDRYAGGDTEKYQVMERLLTAVPISIGDRERAMRSPLPQAPLLPSIMEAPLRSAGANALLPFFASARAPGQFLAGQRAANFVAAGHEADVSAQTKAVNAMVEAATKAGTSLADLSMQATKATSVTADWQQQMLAAIAAEAQFEQQVRVQGAGRGAVFASSVSGDIRALQAGPGTDVEGPQAKRYQQAKEDLASQRQSIIEFYQQRIMAQYQYQIASARSQEDYQRQVGRSEHDFYLSRQRAFSDFALQQRRQVQDAAGSLYNPYERIAATPVFDAYNLIGNEQEQLTAMRQQIQNIRKLKDLGIDDAVIQQLKLYDPNNAQQTAQLVTDLQNNQALVSKYDTVAQRRERLSGQLLSQSPEYQRQVADFKRTMSRQQTDFDTSQSRMRQDFLTQQTRMAQDLHTQDLQITNNMEQLSKDMADIIHGRFVHLHDQVVNSLQGLGRVVNRLWNPINQSLLHPGQQGSSSGAGGTVSSGISVTGSQSGGGFGNSAVGSSVGPVHTPGMHTTIGETTSAAKYVRPGTGQVYTGSTFDAEVPSDDFIKKHPADPNFNMSIAKQMMPEWSKGAQWKAWHDLWDAESHWNQYDHNNSDPNHMGQGAYGIPQAYPGHKMSASGKDWMTNPATQIKWGIGHIKGYGSPLDVARKMHLYNADGSYPSPQYIGYEYGGIATSPHLGMVAEKGKPEAMIPLNAHGMSFMVGALKQYIGTDAAKQISGGGMAYATHIDNSVHHYDNRADFRGSQIKVESNDPADLGKKLDQRAREANLTATRGVTWRPS